MTPDKLLYRLGLTHLSNLVFTGGTWHQRQVSQKNILAKYAEGVIVFEEVGCSDCRALWSTPRFTYSILGRKLVPALSVAFGHSHRVDKENDMCESGGQ